MPSDVPISIWRHTNDPAVTWQFYKLVGGPTDLAETYELTIVWLKQLAPLVRSSTDGGLIVDRTASIVRWSYTLEESALIPQGSSCRYELMGTISGHTRLWAGGTLTARSWRL